jgi:hypothetical protein
LYDFSPVCNLFSQSAQGLCHCKMFRVSDLRYQSFLQTLCKSKNSVHLEKMRFVDVTKEVHRMVHYRPTMTSLHHIASVRFLEAINDPIPGQLED